MDKNKIIDQSELAQSVSDHINYQFFDHFLVKPLDPIKVTKEFSKPVTARVGADEEGIEAADYEEVETEVKEVDALQRKGIVIKCPTYYDEPGANKQINIGDIVIFRDAAGQKFDLIKDSRLLRLYDIIGVEK